VVSLLLCQGKRMECSHELLSLCCIKTSRGIIFVFGGKHGKERKADRSGWRVEGDDQGIFLPQLHHMERKYIICYYGHYGLCVPIPRMLHIETRHKIKGKEYFYCELEVMWCLMP